MRISDAEALQRRGVRRSFWRDALALQGSITPIVIPTVLTFGGIAALITLIALVLEEKTGVRMGIASAPHEYLGAALGLLLVLRNNAGHDRWWEARRLWGGIVNQCRNLVISGLAYGPADRHWREELVWWTAAFPHAARRSLRSERELPELEPLIGTEETARVAAAQHMPTFVAWKLAGLLRRATENGRMEPFAFMQVDRERAQLIDHVGACERILKTPLPLVYSIKIRRFILLYLLTLPLALFHKVGASWMVPVLTAVVAYPLVSLDHIGVELQNPFAVENLNHLPLDDISRNIEGNLQGLLAADREQNSDEAWMRGGAMSGTVLEPAGISWRGAGPRPSDRSVAP
jgi:putative membrane protein